MNKKLLLLSCFIVFLISLLYSVKTLSSYYSSMNVTVPTIYSAAWSFKANNEISNLSVDLGDLYPGINRSFNINLSSIGSEVPIEYTITFSNSNNIPAKLKFYKDFFKQEMINLNGGTVTGSLAAQSTKMVTIYYDWEYEGIESAGSGNASFSLSVFGRQKDPNSN